jgi:hypothetical protein
MSVEGFVAALLISFGVIFVAELGDKSQLMAMTFAARYRAATVLVAITIATAVVHLVSVAIGLGLGTAIPTGPIGLLAGLAFLGFGAWTLRGDSLTAEEKEKAANWQIGALASGRVLPAELETRPCWPRLLAITRWFGTGSGPPSNGGLTPHPGRETPRAASAGTNRQVRRRRSVRPIRRLADRGGRPGADLTPIRTHTPYWVGWCSWSEHQRGRMLRPRFDPPWR